MPLLKGAVRLCVTGLGVLLVGFALHAARADNLTPSAADSEASAVPASLPPDSSPNDDQGVLSAEDILLYGEIFRADEDSDWSRAEALVQKLQNPILLGHVLADRYLAAHYHASYSQLANWLDDYSDLPQADEIYRLALKRKPAHAPRPKAPLHVDYRTPQYAQESIVPLRSSTRERRRIAAIQHHVRLLVGRDEPSKALSYLEDSSNRKFLTDLESDEMRSWIALSFFIAHGDDEAFSLAHEVAERNRDALPLADWTAGLAAWRLGQFEIAGHHFEALAHSTHVSRWNLAAGAYWGARADLVAGKPALVSADLKIAAAEPTTFYGLLALRQLGQKPTFNWTLPSVDPGDYRRALAIPAIRRAIALGQIGETERAEQEMRRGYALAPSGLEPALISLCAEYHLASTQLHVAEMDDEDDDADLNGALYPIPPYTPENGFTVDRALLYAFMRQESKFKPQAKSGAGAAGLMQIMPGTAVHIAGDRSLRRRNRDKLYDPSYNLSLAQNYIHELLSFVEPQGNLFALAAAYNGGPGNLRRWVADMKIDNDPLMFIESIPARETRIYVERVLANLWLYRYRMNESVPSLDEVAQGEWPLYEKQDPKEVSIETQTPPAASASSPDDAGGSDLRGPALSAQSP